MKVTGSLALLTLMLVLGALPRVTLAQGEPLSREERAAIQSRIAALNSELESLHQQLAEDPGPSPDGMTAPVVSSQQVEEIEERRELEQASASNPFSITTHRRNYLLPLSYNHHPNNDGFTTISDGNSPDRAEAKFQFSAKFNLVEDLLGYAGGDLYFAYTQRSWWQAYNTGASSPFRETNYEPEVFLDFDNHWSLLGWTNTNNRIGLNHESNGRSDDQSRSWNRVIFESTFLKDDWAVTLTPHWRIPESEDEDDNPDIHHYMGYGDVMVAHRFHTDQEASMLLRGNPGDGHLGTQIDYSWPLFGNVRGHVQYYLGYGDSLIDYDHSTHRLGIGFSLNPLFSGGGIDR